MYTCVIPSRITRLWNQLKWTAGNEISQLQFLLWPTLRFVTMAAIDLLAELERQMLRGTLFANFFPWRHGKGYGNTYSSPIVLRTSSRLSFVYIYTIYIYRISSFFRFDRSFSLYNRFSLYNALKLSGAVLFAEKLGNFSDSSYSFLFTKNKAATPW